MAPNQNMSAKFRAALKTELPLWTGEGILSEENARRLSDKYQLGALAAESSRLLSAVIFTIGSLLLAGAVIAFVAANWDVIPNALKLVLLFVALLGLHVTGYWLWQVRGWTRLGHALILCGCLTFGANIGLIAQIFNIQGDWYGAFGAWALGSLAMAWAMRSWAIGLLAVFTSFLWFAGYQDEHRGLVASLYPLALAAVMAPLATWLRSRLLYGGALLGVVLAACVLAGSYGGASEVLLAMGAGGGFLWVIGELHRVTGWRRELIGITAGLGLSALAVAAYWWSYRWVWEDIRPAGSMSAVPVALLVSCVVGGVWLARREPKGRGWMLILVSAAVALLGGSAFWGILSGSAHEVFFIIAVNIAALAVAAALIGISFSEERRAVFWLGSLYIVLLILSRFLEYETSLLLKSAAFLACGIAVIYAGIRYEKYLRRKSQSAPGAEKAVIL